MTTGPLSTIIGAVIMINPGVIVIELAPTERMIQLSLSSYRYSLHRQHSKFI